MCVFWRYRIWCHQVTSRVLWVVGGGWQFGQHPVLCHLLQGDKIRANNRPCLLDAFIQSVGLPPSTHPTMSVSSENFCRWGTWSLQCRWWRGRETAQFPGGGRRCCSLSVRQSSNHVTRGECTCMFSSLAFSSLGWTVLKVLEALKNMELESNLLKTGWALFISLSCSCSVSLEAGYISLLTPYVPGVVVLQFVFQFSPVVVLTLPDAKFYISLNLFELQSVPWPKGPLPPIE